MFDENMSKCLFCLFMVKVMNNNGINEFSAIARCWHRLTSVKLDAIYAICIPSEVSERDWKVYLMHMCSYGYIGHV